MRIRFSSANRGAFIAPDEKAEKGQNEIAQKDTEAVGSEKS
jgi:hypothetical protein